MDERLAVAIEDKYLYVRKELWDAALFAADPSACEMLLATFRRRIEEGNFYAIYGGGESDFDINCSGHNGSDVINLASDANGIRVKASLSPLREKNL